MNLTVLILGLIASLAEVAGGALLTLKKEWSARVQEYFLGLGSGFIIALVFLELIPESIIYLGVTAPVYILIGYATIHFFEHTLAGHLHFGEETHSEVMVSGVATVSAFSGLVIHAFFDGFAIAAAYKFEEVLGFLVFAAVLLHKFPEGFTIASIMLAAGKGRKKAFLASVALGIATMLGVVAIILIEQIRGDIIGMAFAFSAGAALYVGASDLVPELNKSKNRLSPLLVFAGMALFYVVMRLISHWTGHTH